MAKDPAQGEPTKEPSRYAHLFGGGRPTDRSGVRAVQVIDGTIAPTKPTDDVTDDHAARVDDEMKSAVVTTIATGAAPHGVEVTGRETGPVDARTSNHADSRPSKFATFEKWFGRCVATVVSLAVIAAVTIGCVALVTGSWQVNPVLSGSMRPGLSVGGVVISERVPVDQLALRDVIVFREPNDPSTQIVHRIVKLTKSGSGQLLINTQGDANDVRDPWTLTIKGDYVYLARWSIPLVGYVAVAYENNRGIALLGAGVVLIAVAVASLWRPRRREDPSSSTGD